ncbi:MAG: dethiobiotin synthase [Parvibaculaceae bacterium]
MTHIFVTASGTDVGKTVVSTLLIRQLIAQGRSVAALKPVLSGVEGEALSDTDSGRMLLAMGEKVTEEAFRRITPFAFDPPLSPDMAAARAGRTLDLKTLTSFCLEPADKDFVLVEGAGGVLVPVNAQATMADWMVAIAEKTELKVLLVVGSYLGTISHTLTALEALRARGLGPAGIVISTSETNPVPVEETAEVMTRFTGGVPIAIVPRLADGDEKVPDLTALVR